MKTFNQYIIEQEILNLNEGLLGKLSSWFKNLFKTQENLIKNNKPISIDVDIKKIKGPEKPCKLSDITSNKEEMNLINNPKIGFPTTAELLKNSKKYLVDTENKKEYDVQVNRFFYVDGNNTYAIGYSMFDDSIERVENFSNILNIDVLRSISNKSEVEKFICTKLEEDIKKSGKLGLIYNINHPRIKATLIKQGYKVSNQNKNWLTKTL